MSPVQYTCVDMLDLRPVFETGRVIRVIEVIASKSGDLLFASKDDEQALGRAEKLAVFLWRNRPDAVAVGWSAVGRVRERVGPKACLVVSFSDEFWTPSWKAFNLMKLICLST